MAKQASTSNIRFSVVLIVKNDPGIQASLAALQPMVARRTDTEVIVIDASAPTTLADIKDTYAWVNWQYFVNNTGKRITIPEQRNLGIELAQGEVIIFLDANCVPVPAWLDVMAASFDADGLDAVTGPIKSVGGDTTHDAGYERFSEDMPVDECGAANFAVRRSILEEINGFDTNLAYGEDVDLAWRIIDAGYIITFKKQAVIAHDWGQFREELHRAFRYGTSRVTLYKKHTHRWRNLLGLDINVLIYPGFLLLLPLTIWFPWYPLLLLVPLAKNWNNEPFKKTFLHFVYGAGAVKGLFKDV
jgi:cellulose synthase/poly-beta-1,6-N-acetylglucosamine synthase-like glycosyltransferase